MRGRFQGAVLPVVRRTSIVAVCVCLVSGSLFRMAWNLWTYAAPNFASDTLAVFPAPPVADFFGVRDSLYQGSLAEGFYEGVHAGWSWTYGPLFHVLTLPMLAFENLATGWKWFLFITVLAYLLAVILLFQVLRPRVDRWQEILPFALVTLNFYPVSNALTLRAIEIFEFLFIAVAMWWSSKEHRTPVTEAATGLALAAGALTKFIPGVLIFGLFAGRRWTALRWSIGGTAAGLALAHLTLGLGNNPMFAGIVPSEDSTYFGECQIVDNCTYSSHLHNQALSGFLLRTAAT